MSDLFESLGTVIMIILGATVISFTRGDKKNIGKKILIISAIGISVYVMVSILKI